MGKRQLNKKNYLQLRSIKKRVANIVTNVQNSSLMYTNNITKNKELIRMYLNMSIDRSSDMALGFKRELRELQSKKCVGNDFIKEECTTSQENVADDISSLVMEEEETNSKIMALKQQNRWFQETIDMAQAIPRPKFHWDYILAEMTWLSEDFNREKTWKRICAKKLANAVVKSLREKKNQISKEAKKETFKLKKNCANIAKIIKDWWKQMEKIVLAKQQFRLNAKRQEAVTTHLGKVIETTERYTEWLTEDLNSTSLNNQSELFEDPDFTAKLEDLEHSDNEETLEIDEEEIEKTDGCNKKEELENLKMEAEMDINDLIEILPEEYINALIQDKEQRLLTNVESDAPHYPESEVGTDSDMDPSSSSCSDGEDDDDKEEENSEDDSSDDEDTFIEQELFEDKLSTNDNEVESLANEANIPMEELLKNYESVRDQLDFDRGDSCVEDDTSTRRRQSSLSCSSSSPSVSSQPLKELIQLNDEDNKVNNTFGFEGEFEALAEAALSTQPKGFTIQSAGIKVQVPHLIRHTLREYQCVGLDWLAAIYEKRLNGILADEMGLGKTIQTIALLAYMACEKAIWGPHLIIVPTSVILNWDIEFKKWCPGFKILTYYGSAKERKDKRKGWTKTNAFHVCITSYKLAIQDSLSFKRKKWKYLILDEAQNIKNFKSQRWQTLLTFNSQRRLLLTGTPLQNNLMELWSLMHFLMPHIFQSHKEFQEWFGSPLTGMIEGNAEYNEQLVKRLHKVLRPFILRRLKKDVEKQMPKKYEHVIMCKLSKRQRCLYDDFMSLSSTKQTLDSGQFLNVINILMQLRKVCNHPNLFETRPTISPFLIINELELKAPRCIFIHDFHLDYSDRRPTLQPQGSTLTEMALNLPIFVSQRIQDLKVKPQLIEEIDCIESLDWVTKQKLNARNQSFKVGRTFISQNLMFLNYLEDPSHTMEQPENLLNYAGLSIVERQEKGVQIHKKIEAMERKPQLPEHITFSRKCRRLQMLKSMSEQNSIRCEMTSSYGPDIIDLVSLRRSNCMNYDGWNSGGHVFTQRKSLNHFYKMTADIIKRFVFVVPPAISNGIRVNKNSQMSQRELRFSESLLPEIKNLIPYGHFQVLNQQRVQFPDTRLIQYDCGKLQTLEILLKRLHKESHRCLIFTQMTRMLDILEQFLSYLGYRYLRLDGSTKVEQRQIMMEKFNQDPKIFIFILSTRSGGLGINLTGADTVIFYDSDWNPTMDAQAQDRCHRIGQTRDVNIYRLISQMTVEENILKKANQKRTLNDMAIEGGQFNTAFFKSSILQDLFKTPSGLEDLMTEQNLKENEISIEKPVTTDSKAVITRSGRLVKWRGVPLVTSSPQKPLTPTIINETCIPVPDNMVEMEEFEAALEELEDENDRLAASKAKAEMKADLAEFDETIPWEEIDNTNDSGQNNNNNKTENKESDPMFHLDTERQIKEFQEQLNPIQRYGVRMIEAVVEDTLTDQLEMAHQTLESSKKTWHLEQLKALHEADEMRAEIEEDDMLYCYGKYDPLSQKKELQRLLKEEAEYVIEEKRKTDEQLQLAKADAARKTWSRQQHLLALKRKHFQSNSHYNKVSRTIKQNKMLSGSEHQNISSTVSKEHGTSSINVNPHSDITSTQLRPLKQRKSSSFMNNQSRQFYPRLRFNYLNHPFYEQQQQTQTTHRSIFHPSSKTNFLRMQNPHNTPVSFGKQVIQSQVNFQNQVRSFHPNTYNNFHMTLDPTNVKHPRPLAMKKTDGSNQKVPNQTIVTSNNTTHTINHVSKIPNISNANTFVNTTIGNNSSIQIPMQTLCNFGASLPTQQLIINSQPILFINPQMPAQNSSFLSQVSSSGSQAMIQIINQNPGNNVSQQQNRFSTPNLISDRSSNPRFHNILSIPTSQSFFVPSLTRNPTNIIRINSNISLSKPDYSNHNIVSMPNIVASPMSRFSAATNSNYQSSLSSPMIIINNNINHHHQPGILLPSSTSNSGNNIVASPLSRFSAATNSNYQSSLSSPVIIINNNVNLHHQPGILLPFSTSNSGNNICVTNNNIRSSTSSPTVHQIISSVNSQIKTNNLPNTKQTLDSGQFLNIINILMQLRKVCNHPNLFEIRPTISPFFIINELESKAPRSIFIHDFYLDYSDRRPTLQPQGSILTEMALNLPIKYVLKVILIDGIESSDWDGSTKVEQRQILMGKFNQDPGGGLGINLKGADTVVFYDSDWNPTMDAQTQEKPDTKAVITRSGRLGKWRGVPLVTSSPQKLLTPTVINETCIPVPDNMVDMAECEAALEELHPISDFSTLLQ